MSFNELSWVEFLKKKTKKGRNPFAGIGDDCAVIKDKGKYYLITSDLFIEDVHFELGNISPLNIGRRAAARAISDIAACAGRPKFVIVSAGIPDYITTNQMKKIAEGIEKTSSLCGAFVAGGDTSKTSKLFLDVWVAGEAKKPILRSGAKVGDYIFITGRLGKLAFNKPFMPKLKESGYLAKNFKVNAMIDISDGFIIDLYRLLKESGHGALLFKDKILTSCGESDFYRGEDYELIFTIDKSEPKLELLKKKFNWAGYIKEKKYEYYFASREGSKQERIKTAGYLHF